MDISQPVPGERPSDGLKADHVVLGLPVDPTVATGPVATTPTATGPGRQRVWCCALQIAVLVIAVSGIVVVLLALLGQNQEETGPTSSFSLNDSYSVGSRMIVDFGRCRVLSVKLMEGACYRILEFGLAQIDEDRSLRRHNVSAVYRNASNRSQAELLVSFQFPSENQALTFKEYFSTMSASEIISHIDAWKNFESPFACGNFFAIFWSYLNPSTSFFAGRNLLSPAGNLRLTVDLFVLAQLFPYHESSSAQSAPEDSRVRRFGDFDMLGNLEVQQLCISRAHQVPWSEVMVPDFLQQLEDSYPQVAADMQSQVATLATCLQWRIKSAWPQFENSQFFSLNGNGKSIENRGNKLWKNRVLSSTFLDDTHFSQMLSASISSKSPQKAPGMAIFQLPFFLRQVPCDIMKRITPRAWSTDPFFRQVDELEGIPVINIHLWFDRKLHGAGLEELKRVVTFQVGKFHGVFPQPRRIISHCWIWCLDLWCKRKLTVLACLIWKFNCFLLPVVSKAPECEPPLLQPQSFAFCLRGYEHLLQHGINGRLGWAVFVDPIARGKEYEDEDHNWMQLADPSNITGRSSPTVTPGQVNAGVSLCPMLSHCWWIYQLAPRDISRSFEDKQTNDWNGRQRLISYGFHHFRSSSSQKSSKSSIKYS